MIFTRSFICSRARSRAVRKGAMMLPHLGRLSAVFVFLLLALAHPAPAAQIEVPAYRALGAAEAMASPAQSGSDYSANAPSLAGLSLLATIPASTQPRLGYLIQAQCAAGLTIAFDDAAGALAPTLVVLAGPSTNGGQGGSLSM